MAQRQPFATQVPLAQSKFVLPKPAADTRAVCLEREERGARGHHQMLADDPSFGNGTAFVRQEGLQKWTVHAAVRTVVSQVDLKRAHADVGHEPRHRGDRPTNHPELGDGLIQGSGMAANLNDQLSGERLLAASEPAGKGANADGAKRKAGHRIEVELPAALGEVSS
jgi:hypothetical protein